MIEDNLELQCPHCESKLGIDDAGDLCLLEAPPLADGENRGLGGLRVIEADPTWKRFDGLHNQQLEKRRATEPGIAPRLGPDPIPAAPTEVVIEAANTNDIKERGLKL